jgi:hypothetical protein
MRWSFSHLVLSVGILLAALPDATALVRCPTLRWSPLDMPVPTRAVRVVMFADLPDCMVVLLDTPAGPLLAICRNAPMDFIDAWGLAEYVVAPIIAEDVEVTVEGHCNFRRGRVLLVPELEAYRQLTCVVVGGHIRGRSTDVRYLAPVWGMPSGGGLAEAWEALNAGLGQGFGAYVAGWQRLGETLRFANRHPVQFVEGFMKGLSQLTAAGLLEQSGLKEAGTLIGQATAAAAQGDVRNAALYAGKAGGRFGPEVVEACIMAGLGRSQDAADYLRKRRAANTETALVRVGDRLTTVDDVLRNPSLLAGKGPAEIQAILGRTPSWQVEALGKGSHAGQGWVLREYTAAGNPTGRMLRWHPAGGHHGPNPYWRVTGGVDGKSGIILGGPEP